MALAKNTRTGKIASVPDHYIGDPVLGKWLVAVGGNQAEAAPKNKKVNKSEKDEPKWFTALDTKIEEQPAPEINIENEENEDGN